MQKFKFLLAIASLAVLAACGGGNSTSQSNNPPVTPPPTDTATGIVTFKGAPLAGATVTAYDTNVSKIYGVTTTDANGSYSFSGMSTMGDVPEEYHFWISKTGYGFYPSLANGGAKITRADHTGDFEGNGVTDIGIYLTVIDFVSLPNASLTGANFIAFDGSNPVVSVASTGQSTSYATGDDGSVHKGVAWPAIRYKDNQDGTVTDNLTGLIWLKNAGCFTPTLWANALADVNQLASGSCGLSDGSTAGEWRLPNVNELESLVDASASSPATSLGNYFQNVSNAIYWTSSSYFGGEGGSPNAWTIRMSDGRYVNDSVANFKISASNEVWAVRGSGGGAVKLQATGMYVSYLTGDDGNLQKGVPLNYPRYIDNGNGTITDSVTGLIWLKKADCINQPWSAAVASVNLLASGQCGLTDSSSAGSWRMPNRNEMQSLSDRTISNHADFFDATYIYKNGTPYRNPIFTNLMVSEYYWTSTTDAANTDEAWTIFSCDFGVYDTPKINTGYTLAVR